MPFTDVIDDYTNGTTGTLTDVNGDPVGYSVTGTSPTVNWNSLTDGARVNATGTQTFTVTFDTPVVGAAMQISGSDATEIYYIVVDGVTVDLQTLIANGDVTFTQSGAATHQIGTDGSIFGGSYTDGSIAALVFNIPVTSLGAFGTNGNSGNWDYFEVGIDATLFDVVCFVRGTQIATPTGPRPVQTLRAGDLVMTAHHGAQPIAWIGSSVFSASQLSGCARLRPVCISQGALGQGLPTRDLRVSRQHRMVVSSKTADRMFGDPDVMLSAIKLTELPGIFVDETCEDVTYFHVLLDAHHTIFAEGAPSESLFLGTQTLRTLSQDAIVQIHRALGHTALEMRPHVLFPSDKKQKRLVERHQKNAQPLLSRAFAKHAPAGERV